MQSAGLRRGASKPHRYIYRQAISPRPSGQRAACCLVARGGGGGGDAGCIGGLSVLAILISGIGCVGICG
jgi:hypothetical protein